MTTHAKIKKVKQKIIQAADLFCGAGGTSSGFVDAVQSLGYDFDLVAVNHWDVAIQTHSRNHERARHLCQSIDTINPQDVVPGKRLHILMASPECTDHSNAKGGKPRSDQKRADAWLLMRWIEKLYVENLIIENVKEFVKWGPLNAKGLPDKRYRGMYFNQFIDALRINYSVDWTILNAADYGDATTRERFFLIAKRGRGKKIVFPAPTHISRAKLAKLQPSLLDEGSELKPWVPAREIIDWSLEGQSIFNRKKPLSVNTMRRIFAGLFKYSLKPFIMGTGGRQMDPRDVESPVRTVMPDHRQNLFVPYIFNYKSKDGQTREIDEPIFTQTTEDHQYVVDPYLINMKATERRDRSIDEPIPTVTTEGGMGVAQPYLLGVGGNQGHRRPHDIEDPVKAITGTPTFALAEPFILNLSHTSNKDESMRKEVDDPMPVICGKGMLALIEPFLVKFFGGQHSASVDEPIPTITANFEHYGLAEPRLVKYNGGEDGTHSVDEPLSTVTAKDRLGLAEPFILQNLGFYQGNAAGRSIDEPIPTVTSRGGGAVIEPYIIPCNHGNDERSYSIEEPMKTITQVDAWGMVEPFLVRLKKNQDGQSLDEPLGTLTTKDSYALCIPQLGAIVDIRFRMLQPHELAAAMGFPPGYEFAGTRDQKVRQIGNAVPVNLAKALVKCVLGETK